MSTLPSGDHTPDNYELPLDHSSEKFKKVIRKILYPALNAFNHYRLLRKFHFQDFKPDLFLWGQRGNDYQRHRRRVASYTKIKGQKILVAGCGTGRDIESWAILNPKEIIGVDLFNYEKAWNKWKERFSFIAPEVNVSFVQASLTDLKVFKDESFDIISSDAVFEHIVDFPSVLKEFKRILKPGGILYSTFGPLWYSWGGDHVSGYDDVLAGYNHLMLNQIEYKKYLDKMGEHSHDEHDGRTWIENDLFSKLKPREYLKNLEQAGFSPLFISAIIDPNAVACMNQKLFESAPLKNLELLDLLTSGMTIIYERKK